MMINYQKVPQQQQIGDTEFPAVIVNDQAFTSVSQVEEWITANRSELEAKLNQSAAILFRGFPIGTAEDFDQISLAMGYPNFTYRESLSNAVRINYTERVFTANEAPKDVEINLHNEMAQTPIYPERIMFFCQQAADIGGATPIMRCDALFTHLQQSNPELASEFETKGVKYTTVMPGENDSNSGQGRSWRATLDVSSVEEAEQKLARLGYTWEWLDNGALRAVTKTLPAVLTMDDGRKVFFNQIIAAYMGWQGVRDNPQSALSFGDGSPIPKDGLEQVAEIAESLVFDQNWQDGDVVVINNYLAMHGRRPYSGERKRIVLVVLGSARHIS